MKFATILIAVVLVSAAYSQLVLPNNENEESSILQKILEFFKFENELQIKTQCSIVDLPEHDGVTRSGYLNVGVKNSDSSLAFIFYGANGVAAEDLKYLPTIIWLNGGPGCSSQFGNFYELGPLHVNQTDDGSFYFTKNPYGWTNEYNVIFIDQPVGTGISYAAKPTDIPQNQEQVATQFVHALNELYNTPDGCFQQLGLNGQDTPLFILGESYAGKYVPQISARILEEGNAFNLRGAGIVDGFTIPYYVVGSLSEYALLNNLTTIEEYHKGVKIAEQSQKAINASLYKIASSYFNLDMSINNPENLDVYNIHRDDEPDSSALDNLFNSEFGQNLFNLKPQAYSQCDGTVYSRFASDFMNGDSIHKVEYLLSQGFPVSVFNGNLDLVVPYLGTQDWLAVLNWSGQEEFNNSPTVSWSKDGVVYGTQKAFQNLDYRLVFESGHMVPQDQPAAALDLINSLVNRALNTTIATDV